MGLCVNFDSSVNENLGHVNIREVIHGSAREIILSFSSPLGECSVNVEMEALWIGLLEVC